MTAAIVRALPYRRILRRAPAIAAGALFAHFFAWDGLRSLTADLCLQLSQALGVPLLRLPGFSLAMPGWNFRIDTACTLMDAYFGGMAFLVEGRSRDLWRALQLGVFTQSLNLLRLVGGFWLVHKGVPWWLGHQVVYGLTLYAVFEFCCWLVAEEKAS